MEVQRLPRELFYKWEETGEEIKYPSDLSDPIPEIVCDEVQIEQPPPLPNSFALMAIPYPPGPIFQAAEIYSWAFPTVNVFNYPDGIRQEVSLSGIGFVGQPIVGTRRSRIITRNAWYITPGMVQTPRRDLLVGTDRIINPTINAPCPTWRIAGGNCPPNSKDCGNCCLDCSALNNAINGLTSAVLPYSSWRPR